MTLLFDTHTLLWASIHPEDLSSTAAGLIADRSNTLLVSVASLWEIATKVRLGKLPEVAEFESELPEVLDRSGYRLLDLNASVCLRSARFPGKHGDPFDRLLAAQALNLNRLAQQG